MISFNDAYQLTLENIQPLEVESVDLLAAEGRIAGEDLLAKVDLPTLDVSLKDGYAILAEDIHTACPESPIDLALIGSIFAGDDWQGTVCSGEAVRILSGAPLPEGADAIVSEEFTQAQPGIVRVMKLAEPGRNILRRGTDIHIGQLIVSARQQLLPTAIGFLAAAGFQNVPVIRKPRVAILATGDEVLAPGQPLVPGKLYASNLFTLAAWCLHFGFEIETFVLHDDQDDICKALMTCLEQFDAVLTSGGAWKGEHDLVVHTLDSLGWRKIYHRVRIGPGKAVGFGLYNQKPVFCLPGGPPSNHMAFLQLGLPGLQKLAGWQAPGLPQVPAVMMGTVSGQSDWTQFFHGRLIQKDRCLYFKPLKYASRLQEMAHTQAIVKNPEEQEEVPENSKVMVQVLVSSA